MIKYISCFLILINYTAFSQTTEDVNRIFTDYKKELNLLETSLYTFNSDTIRSTSKLLSLTEKVNLSQGNKFSLDSGYVIYQFLSKRAILDQILSKKALKTKNREQLKSSLLDWSDANCHPRSDQLWHSTSAFFSELGNQLNQFQRQGKNIEMNSFETLFFLEYLEITLPQKINQQQSLVDQILRDLPKK